MACRKRFEIILSDSDRVERAHNKITEYLAKQVEMTEEEMAKKKVKVHETKVEKDGMDIEGMRAQGWDKLRFRTGPKWRNCGILWADEGGKAADHCRAGGKTAAW